MKLVYETHLRWRTFLPKLDTLGLWVFELFAMYATDGQTDGRTDKSNAYCTFPAIEGIINMTMMMMMIFNPLMGTLKPQSNETLYSNTVIGTLAVDGWAVTFGTARSGLGGLRPRPVPSSLYQT